MDLVDKGNVIGDENVFNKEIPIDKVTSIAQIDSNEMELTNDGVLIECDSIKPHERDEIIEKIVENSASKKETIEILSVELVTPNAEIQNTEIENQIPHEGTIQNSNEAIIKDCMQTHIMEESNVIPVIEKVQQSEENKQVTAIENMVTVAETSDDGNMESKTVLETTTNPEDFSTESSTILADIENIQSSVDMEDVTSSNLKSNTSNLTSLPTTVISGLSLLAQYDSDNDDEISDADSVIEVPTTSARDYRNQVVDINSDSDSDESDSSSDVEYLNEIRRTIEKRTEMVDEEAEEDDDEGEENDDNEENMSKRRHKPKLKVKGELLLDDLPPIEDLQITVPEDECIEFGKIHSIVDQLLLVSALPDAILLDLETVIFLEKGQKVLGKVFDVLGQVADPLYCVRFNSNKEIKEKEINVGDVVFVAPKTQYTQYVILSNLMKLKGSDASWENDIEPPPRFLDYSDDEQEQMARRERRNKDRPIDNDDSSKRPRTSEADRRSENSSTNSAHNRDRYRYNQPNSFQRQQQSNYNRNSWHSNYYPQQHQQGPPPPNYGYNHNTRAPLQNQYPSPRQQNYPNQVPVYAMRPMHTMPRTFTMPFPAPLPYGPQAGVSHIPPHQLMPNSFSIGPPAPQFSSPPPPPGSQ